MTPQNEFGTVFDLQTIIKKNTLRSPQKRNRAQAPEPPQTTKSSNARRASNGQTLEPPQTTKSSNARRASNGANPRTTSNDEVLKRPKGLKRRKLSNHLKRRSPQTPEGPQTAKLLKPSKGPQTGASPRTTSNGEAIKRPKGLKPGEAPQTPKGPQTAKPLKPPEGLQTATAPRI